MHECESYIAYTAHTVAHLQATWMSSTICSSLHLRNIKISNFSLHLKRASITVRKLYSFDHTHFNQGSCVVEPVVYVAYSLHQVPLLDILLELLETRAESSPPACSAWVCPPQNIHVRAILSIGWICLCLILLCCHGRKLSAGKAGKMRFSMCYACAFWSIAHALESPRSSHRKMTCAYHLQFLFLLLWFGLDGWWFGYNTRSS